MRLALTCLLLGLGILIGFWMFRGQGTPRPDPSRRTPLQAPDGTRPPGLRGRLVDELGLPIAGATVLLCAAERPDAIATTDPAGSFQLPVPSVPSTLLAHHREFAPRVLRRQPALAVDQQHDLGRFVLPDLPGLLVEVLDPNHTPVRAAQVTIEPLLARQDVPAALRESLRRRAATGADGVAVFYGVAAGPWRVTARAAGRVGLESRHTQPATTTRSPRLTLRLAAAHPLEGRLRGPDDAPIADALVVAWPRSPGHLSGRARTDALGRFRIGDLPEAPCELFVVHPRFRWREELPATPGSIERRLEPGLELTGLVRHGTSGAPIARAKVTARLAGPWQARPELAVVSVDTDATGKFRFRGLTGGISRLEARSNGLCPAESGPIETAGASPITLQLSEGGTVTGTVQDPAGSPFPAAMIRAVPTDHASRAPKTATSGPSGRFRVRGLCPGRYRLWIEAKGFARLLGPEFTVAQTGPHDVGPLRLTPGCVLHGTARLDTGRPARYATVHVRPESGPADAGVATLSDGQGRFRFPPLASGAYRVFYDCPDSQSPRALAATRARTAVTVQLGKGELQQDLRPRAR